MTSWEYLKDYGSVKRYLSRLAPTTQRNMGYYLHYFFVWVRENSEKFKAMNPDEMVEYQRQAGNGAQYDILDVVQDYVTDLEGRRNYKKTLYTAVRGFFKANRAALPQDDYKIQPGEKGLVQGKLTVEELRELILSSKQVYRALFICMFSGGIGQDEIVTWSDTGLQSLMDQLKGDPEYVRVNLPGRKANKNIRPFYTILMGDALDQLRKWMDERPREASTVFCNQFGDPITKKAIYTYWLRHMRDLGYTQPGEDSSHRTGRNPHEVRDLFRTQWEKSPAASSPAEFAMGHVVDELGYNKAHLDERWMVGEFRKASPMLNILSSGRPFGQVDENEVERLRRELEEAKLAVGERDRRLDSMEWDLSVIKRALSHPEGGPVLWKALKELEEKTR